MKRFLLLICISLLIFGCPGIQKPQGDLTSPSEQIETGNKIEKEVAEFFFKLDKSWNEKDWITFNFLFSEDLQMYVAGDATPWNYKKYIDSTPERRERMSTMKTQRFKILRKISDTSIKVECVLNRNGKDFYNIFNMKKHSLHGWQIVSNDRT